jgi:hypothetical protein
MPTAAVMFCDRCGSEKVDVAGVAGSKARNFRIRCFNCSHESKLKGFTLGRAEVPEPVLREARGGRAGTGTVKMPRLTE